MKQWIKKHKTEIIVGFSVTVIAAVIGILIISSDSNTDSSVDTDYDTL